MPFLILAGTMALLGAQAPLVFPTTTELVKVVVSVTDASGQPIRGLISKDFAAREPFARLSGGSRPADRHQRFDAGGPAPGA